MAEWVHTFKGAVLASEYDFASHMNSRMYVSRFDQATWFLLHAIGDMLPKDAVVIEEALSSNPGIRQMIRADDPQDGRHVQLLMAVDPLAVVPRLDLHILERLDAAKRAVPPIRAV